jgi:hypothetical protein
VQQADVAVLGAMVKILADNVLPPWLDYSADLRQVDLDTVHLRQLVRKASVQLPSIMRHPVAEHSEHLLLGN